MVQVALAGLELSNAVVQVLPATAEPITPLLSLNNPNVTPTSGAPLSSVLTIFTAPQSLMFWKIGAVKSLMVLDENPLVDPVLVLAKTDETFLQVPGVKKPGTFVRFTTASPKSPSAFAP